MALHHTVTWLNISNTSYICVCQGCKQGKQHQTSFPKNTNAERELKRAKYARQFFHSGITRPLELSLVGGHRYFVTFKDDYSHFLFVF